MASKRRVRLYDDHRSDRQGIADMSYLRLRNLWLLDLGNPQGTAHWKMYLAERLVRVILCAGFVAVLAVEISLLIQTLRIYG